LLDKRRSEGKPLSELVQLAGQQVVEEALEGKVRDLLGRDNYEHQDDAEGYGNSYRPGRLQTGEGEIRYASPQVRGRQGRELAELRRLLRGRSDALEQLAIKSYARGCSTRDVEAVFCDDEGRSPLSRSAVSELTENLWEEYKAFATRDLSELRPLYLSVDGIAERLRAGAKREAIRVPGRSPGRGPRCWCTWRRGRRNRRNAAGISFRTC
jgi:transposase-like protein